MFVVTLVRVLACLLLNGLFLFFVQASLADSGIAESGRAGFVIGEIKYVLGPDAADADTCPLGMTRGYGDGLQVIANPEELGTDENDAGANGRRRSYSALRENPNIKNFCSSPELGEQDLRFKTLSGTDPKLEGLDIDLLYAQNGFPPVKTCPHRDFPGMDGRTVIDNQFYRFAGCSPSFQSTGISNSFGTSMLTGAWGILIEIDGIDSLQDDDEVTVSFYANKDPIKLSAARNPIPYATYSPVPGPRYRSSTSGRIQGGVLTTTNPIDLRFQWVVNTMYMERTLNDAVLQMKVNEDGGLEGFIAGYAQVEDVYDFLYGYRNGKDRFGNPAAASLRIGSSIGKSMVQGYTCQGAYQALYRMADGNMDETGQCHSISMQYRIRALPAFIVPHEQSGEDEKS